MLTIERCRKILGTKADGLSDEEIEAQRDELYVVANLAFENWRKSSSSTKEEETSSLTVGEMPTSTKLHAGDSADVNKQEARVPSVIRRTLDVSEDSQLGVQSE